MRLWINLAVALALASSAAALAGETATHATDPVTNKQITVVKDTPKVVVNEEPVYFTNAESRQIFLKSPEKYLKKPLQCPVRNTRSRAASANRLVVNDHIFYFCCSGCPEDFQRDPSSYVSKLPDPVSGKEFSLSADAPRAQYKGGIYFFENEANKAAFARAPAKYARVVLQ